ncbi:hypothetical protein EXN66_Car021023 [Channa argus]|uniref:Uncharacterized protein n=1 Tax=Channa argus TaxID=215402 RepID=A0A6G1QRU8_CHAAH|nr:hypothetical protein EXN66_Car021023 [Channa argus]
MQPADGIKSPQIQPESLIGDSGTSSFLPSETFKVLWKLLLFDLSSMLDWLR